MKKNSEPLFYVKIPTYFYATIDHIWRIAIIVVALMADNKEINSANHSVIEGRWLSMVNEIQQQHNVLIELIEKLEQNPVANQRTVYQLTVLQQHVLDTLNHLLAESLSDTEPVAPSQLSERLKKKHHHSQVLVQLKQEIDRELANLTS